MFYLMLLFGFPCHKVNRRRLNILHNVNDSYLSIGLFQIALFEVQKLVNFVVLEFVSTFHIDVKWPAHINKVFICSNIFCQISLLGFLSTENMVLFSWFQSFVQNFVPLGVIRAFPFVNYLLCFYGHLVVCKYILYLLLFPQYYDGIVCVSLEYLQCNNICNMVYTTNVANVFRRSENLLEYDAVEAISILLCNVSSLYSI